MRPYDGNPGRAHAYEPHPGSSAEDPPCLCGLWRRYRIHQPLLWRLRHWRENFR